MARNPEVEYPGAIDHVACRMIGERKAFDFVESTPLPVGMSGKWRDWPKRYREFVETGLAAEDEDIKLALKESPRSIGGERFRGWVDGLCRELIEGHRHSEDALFRRIKIGAGSGGAVSRQMRKVRVLLASERPLRRLVECADKRIEELRSTMRKPQSGIAYSEQR
ncbi:MAG: hypothetical protein WC381_08420 [Kiritimatiellia bacterium]|jgi:hypothetical protein